MAKYETTIKIKARDRVPDLRTILEGLFYRKPLLARKAEQLIYSLLDKKRLPDREWATTMQSLECSHQEYYTVLNKLRDAGMITKSSGDWVLSEQYGNRMQEMSDIWASFIKRWRA